MKWMDEFDSKLKERYEKLYGKKGWELRLQRDKKGLLTKAAAAAGLILLVLCANLMASFENSRDVRVNGHGEIIEIMRPSSKRGALSFHTEVEVVTKEGSLIREYCITIEPSGTASETNSSSGDLFETNPEEEREHELRSIISKLNADTTSKKVRLPKELKSGEKLTWSKTSDSNIMLYLIAFAGILFLLYKTRFYAIEKEERAARESIIRELPEFINKIVLRLNAGSVLTAAFTKTLEDARQTDKSNTYFYRQMEQIVRSVKEANGSLHEELKQFSKRSGVNELVRITNIINDNISKGADLSEKLKKENELLWFARKQNAEEKGRLAETKLTMPLMLLLLVLIMITIAPALMEM